MGIGVETSLRAEISAATFAINAYLELYAASDQSTFLHSEFYSAMEGANSGVGTLARSSLLVLTPYVHIFVRQIQRSD